MYSFLSISNLISAEPKQSENLCHAKARQECLECCKVTTTLHKLYYKYCPNEIKTLSKLETNKLKNEVEEATIDYLQVEPKLNPKFYPALFDTNSCLDLKVLSNFESNTQYKCSKKCKVK